MLQVYHMPPMSGCHTKEVPVGDLPHLVTCLVEHEEEDSNSLDRRIHRGTPSAARTYSTCPRDCHRRTLPLRGAGCSSVGFGLLLQCRQESTGGDGARVILDSEYRESES